MITKTDRFNLVEAACALMFADPDTALMTAGTRYRDDVQETLARLVCAIESGELPHAEDTPNAADAGPWIHSATTRAEMYEPEQHERRSRYTVARADLIAFAKRHDYNKGALLRDDPQSMRARLATGQHAVKLEKYADPIDEAVTRWRHEDQLDHVAMRDALMRKQEYGNLDPATLLRELRKAARENGYPHLINGTPESRAHRAKTPT